MRQAIKADPAMQRALDVYPYLDKYGFADPDSARTQKGADEITLHRAAMLEPDALEQFAVARTWLRQWRKTKQAARRGTSYGLKHVAEPTIGYVTNGVFIAAAYAEGFTVVPISGTPNAYFNIAAAAWMRSAKSARWSDRLIEAADLVVRNADRISDPRRHFMEEDIYAVEIEDLDRLREVLKDRK